MAERYLNVTNRKLVNPSYPVKFFALCFIMLFAVLRGYGTITVTAASASICTNYASTGPAPHWTTLGTMTVTEGAATDMGNVAGAWTATVTVVPPTGWQFNSSATPTLGFTAAKNITSVTRSSFTSTTLVISIAGTNKTQVDAVTIAGLQVQPTSTSAATGNIKPSTISGTMTGLTTSSNFGTLTATSPSAGSSTISVTPSPTGAICSGTSVTFSSSITNGGTAPLYQWVKNSSSISGATASTYSSSSFANSDVIKCTLISNSCIVTPTATATAVTMTVNPTPDVSTFTGTSAANACFGGAAVITLSSTSLGAGTFTANYSISGDNNNNAGTATLTMGSSTGTFSIPSSTLDTLGSTIVIVNSISIGSCSATVSANNTDTFSVNPSPSAVILGPATSDSVCLGSGVASTASVTYTGIPVSLDFNTGYGGWSINNTGSTHTWTDVVWTIVHDGYTYTRVGTFHSPDNSNFLVSVSDTAGSGSTVHTIITSPTFSLVGYTSATLAFQHFYYYYSADVNANIEISTNGGSTWTVLQNYQAAATSAGAYGTFASASFSLSSYLGMSNLQIRFNYNTVYGWCWALDNVKVSGAYTPTYTWAGVGAATGLSCTSCTSPTITPTATGVNVYSVTASANGCSSSATDTVNVNPLPTAISGTTSYCAAGTATLNSTPSGGTWTSSNTSYATIGSTSGTVTGVAAGTPTITYTLPTTCYVTTPVTVIAAPSLSGATNTTPICAGVSFTLTANSPSNVTSYSWSGPVSVTSSTSASASVPSATTAASGTYTVTVSNGTGAGCSINYTTTATVNATPTAGPTNNGAICTGGTVTLTANPGGSASAYTWSGPNLSSSTVQNPTATPTTTATYSLTVTNGTTASGCVTGTVYTTTVSVNATPTAAPTNSGPVCSSSSVTLTANPGGSANTYTWSGPNLSSSTAQNPTATPTTTATYSLTVSYLTGHPGCSPSTIYTTTVTVRPTGYWLAATSRTWTDATNWCGGVPSSTTDVIIPTGSAYQPLLTGTGSTHNLTVQSGSTVTDSTGTLQIAGSISNSGTINATNGSITMNGSAAQTIPASTFSTNTIANLTVNNSSGVTLGGALNISGVVLVSSGTLASGGNLTLLSTATQTALVNGSGSGSISGNVTMQRYLDTSYGYRYLSSPFTDATIGQLGSYLTLQDTTFPTVYRYLENDSTNGYIVDTAAADTMKVANGYACNFGTSFSPETIALTGVVNNGTLSYTFYNHNKTYTLGYNLIGNPYPSPIDWSISGGVTTTNIDNALYYFNNSDTNRYTGVYDSWVSGVSSDGRASSVIPSMQGFFVHVSTGSYPVTGSLTFSNTARTTGLTPVFHRETASSTRSLLRLTAGFNGDGSHADATVIYLDDSGSADFNNHFDALKLMNTDKGVPSLYSVSQDNNNLSIYALPTSLDSIELVPLGLQTLQDGQVTFNAQDMDNIPAGLHLYFYDTKLGKIQDLVTDPKYTLYLGAAKYVNRFFIMFTTKEKINIPGYNGELNAYTDGKNIHAFLTGGTGTLVIYDVLGQVVAKQQFSGTGYHELYLDVAAGVYLATMYSDMGKQVKKLFIAQ
jgi:fibronectin-binding autotransporter adhesin